jgi:hypothetical protein
VLCEVRLLSGMKMIDPTDSEIWFVNWLVNKLRGEATLDGSIVQLKIDRLIPDYVTHVSAGMNTGVFTLTERDWELARKYPRE